MHCYPQGLKPFQRQACYRSGEPLRHPKAEAKTRSTSMAAGGGARSTSSQTDLLGQASLGALEEEGAFADVLGEGCGAGELGSCFVEAAQLFEEISADAGEEMIVLE